MTALMPTRDELGCILGQKFADRVGADDFGGGFVIGLFELFNGSLAEATRHGFTTGCGGDTFDALTAEWRRVIQARSGGRSV